jgi:hypothetical protein
VVDFVHKVEKVTQKAVANAKYEIKQTLNNGIDRIIAALQCAGRPLDLLDVDQAQKDLNLPFKTAEEVNRVFDSDSLRKTLRQYLKEGVQGRDFLKAVNNKVFDKNLLENCFFSTYK